MYSDDIWTRDKQTAATSEIGRQVYSRLHDVASTQAHCWQSYQFLLFPPAGDRYSYDNSSVGEMGDRLATIDIGRKVGAAVPFAVGEELGPHLTVSPGQRPICVPSDILMHATV